MQSLLINYGDPDLCVLNQNETKLWKMIVSFFDKFINESVIIIVLCGLICEYLVSLILSIIIFYVWMVGYAKINSG